MNGLSIKPEEFELLPQKQQMKVLYQNTEDIKKLLLAEQEKLQRHVDDDKFSHKLQWTAITVVFAIAGTLKYFGWI